MTPPPFTLPAVASGAESINARQKRISDEYKWCFKFKQVPGVDPALPESKVLYFVPCPPKPEPPKRKWCTIL